MGLRRPPRGIAPVRSRSSGPRRQEHRWLGAQRAGVQLGLSYPTALRAYTTVRRAMLASAEPALFQQEVEADESYFGPRRSSRHRGQGTGRAAPAKIPVFGILERHGRVQVSVVPDCSAESLLRETLRAVRRGSLVYTDRWQGYDTLTFCGYRHLRVDHGRRVSRPSASGKVHINGLEGFWSYAKGRLQKHHGVSPAKFPLYLYEMQFRYNNRDRDLFDARGIASLVFGGLARHQETGEVPTRGRHRKHLLRIAVRWIGTDEVQPQGGDKLAANLDRLLG